MSKSANDKHGMCVWYVWDLEDEEIKNVVDFAKQRLIVKQ